MKIYKYVLISLAAVLIIGSAIIIFSKRNKTVSQASDNTAIITTKAEWEQGTLSNIDTTSSEGDIKISQSGVTGWTAKTAGPINSFLGGFGSDGTYLYVSLGAVNNNYDDPELAYRYDPGANSWSSIANLNTLTNFSCMAGADSHIYKIGGRTQFSPYPHEIEMYDSGSNSWQNKANPIESHTHPVCASYNDKIYVFGGSGDGPATGKVSEVYDPTSNSWTQIADVPSNLLYGNTAAYNGFIYLFRDTVAYKYNIATNEWTTLAAVPFSAVAAATLGSNIYVLSSSGATIYKFNPSDESYTLIMGVETVPNPAWEGSPKRPTLPDKRPN